MILFPYLSIKQNHHMIKITSGQYLNGMSDQDETSLDFGNGVIIQLNAERFLELANAINAKGAKDIEAAQKADKIFFERSKKFGELIKEALDFFYDTSSEDYAVRRETKEIDPEKLNELLDRYSTLLGLG